MSNVKSRIQLPTRDYQYRGSVCTNDISSTRIFHHEHLRTVARFGSEVRLRYHLPENATPSNGYRSLQRTMLPVETILWSLWWVAARLLIGYALVKLALFDLAHFPCIRVPPGMGWPRRCFNFVWVFKSCLAMNLFLMSLARLPYEDLPRIILDKLYPPERQW